MIKKRYLFLAVSIFYTFNVNAADPVNIKKGWNIGPLPALGYDSDRGFLFGATGEAYYFGDGSIYPNYFHKLKAEVSFYTKGSANIQAYYDSKYLIKGVRTMFDAGYFPDRYYDFYGINAYSYPVLENLLSGVFNKVDRNLFRFQADFQRKLYKDLNIAAGAGLWSYQLRRVQEDKYREDITLFDIYEADHLLSPKEINGGTHLLLKLGLIYDTRDHESDPGKGFCTEAIFSGSPDIFERNGYEHLRLAIIHRHFINIVENRLTLALRAGYQNTLAGEVPYYLLQNMNTFFQRRLFNEGLGGNTTVRGILRNRLVSDDEGWANLEFRWKFYRFRFIRQDFVLALTPFADACMILKQHDPELFKNYPEYENPEGKVHMSLGMGLKVIMNQNFVVSIDFGKALLKEDGNTGLYILLNYMF